MDDTQQNDSEMVAVKFSILGQTFSVSCKKENQVNFNESIEHVKKFAADLLGSNPNMSPIQAAILTAVDSENRLLTYQTEKSPFIKKAEKLIAEIESNANKIIDG